MTSLYNFSAYELFRAIIQLYDIKYSYRIRIIFEQNYLTYRLYPKSEP